MSKPIEKPFSLRVQKRTPLLPFIFLAWLSWMGPVHAMNERGLDERVLAEHLETVRVQENMPGLRAAVRFADARVIRAAVGLADKENGTPLDNRIGMPGGSTGKTFVATLTLLLVEDGLLKPGDPVERWLGDRPWYPEVPNADSMRVLDLLSHSAGLADYIEKPGFHLSMIGRVIRHGSAYFEPEELIGFVQGDKPLFAPGEGFHYSDVGYLVLGRLIEAAGGKPYYDLLLERILVPQGLTETRPADTSVLPGIATGYMSGSRNLKKDGRMKFDPRSEWTGGGLVTNPTMLVLFFGALAEGRVLQPASLETMLNSGWRDPDSEGARYGLGVFVDDQRRTFGHGGLWPGYRTQVTHFRETGVTVAIQTNRDGRIDMEAIVAGIAALADPR